MLFHWKKITSLMNHVEGDVIVDAKNVEDAREKALKEADEYWKTELEPYRGSTGGVKKKWKEHFSKDILSEPDIVSAGVVIFQGSD